MIEVIFVIVISCIHYIIYIPLVVVSKLVKQSHMYIVYPTTTQESKTDL